MTAGVLLLLAVVGIAFGLKVLRGSGRSGVPTVVTRRDVPPPLAKPVPMAASAEVFQGHAHVVDGDTIMIRDTSIRIGGIDAPELDHRLWQEGEMGAGRAVQGRGDPGRGDRDRS